MNLYDAMYVRKSIRNFEMEKLEQSVIDNIMKFANSLQSLDEKYNVEYNIIENKTGAIPYYFVISSKEMENHLVNAGYLMCQVSLYMTAKGIGSCYQGKLPVSREFKNLNYSPAVILAFGKSKTTPYRDISKIRRFKYEKISFLKGTVGDDVKKLLKAATLAPSSYNSQPWRFVAYDNRIHIFCVRTPLMYRKMSILNQIDIGNAVACIMTKAEELWIDVVVRRIDDLAEKQIKKNEYIISILLR